MLRASLLIQVMIPNKCVLVTRSTVTKRRRELNLQRVLGYITDLLLSFLQKQQFYDILLLATRTSKHYLLKHGCSEKETPLRKRLVREPIK